MMLMPIIQYKLTKGKDLIVPNWKHVLLYNETTKASKQLKSSLLLDVVNSTDDEVYTWQAVYHPDSHSESQVNLTVECKMINYTERLFCNLVSFHLCRCSTCFHSESITLCNQC